MIFFSFAGLSLTDRESPPPLEKEEKKGERIKRERRKTEREREERKKKREEKKEREKKKVKLTSDQVRIFFSFRSSVQLKAKKEEEEILDKAAAVTYGTTANTDY